MTSVTIIHSKPTLELNSIPSYICTLLSYASTCHWRTMFCFSAVVNKGVMDTRVQTYLWQGMKFSGYVPRCEIVGSKSDFHQSE